MTTTLKPATITVRFDVDAARRDLERAGRVQPVSPGSQPKTPSDAETGSRPSGEAGRPDRRHDGQGSTDDAPGGRIGRTIQTANRLRAAALGGGLDDELLGTLGAGIASIPLVGPVAAAGLRGAQLAERYGPGVTGALKGMTAPNTPERALADQAEEFAAAYASRVSAVRTPLRAVGVTFEQVSDVAALSARLRGSVDVKSLGDLTQAAFKANEFQMRSRRAVQIAGQRYAGEALGETVRGILDQFSRGGAGR